MTIDLDELMLGGGDWTDEQKRELIALARKGQLFDQMAADETVGCMEFEYAAHADAEKNRAEVYERALREIMSTTSPTTAHMIAREALEKGK